jgi:hypothetical protein
VIYDFSKFILMGVPLATALSNQWSGGLSLHFNSCHHPQGVGVGEEAKLEVVLLVVALGV